MQEYQNDTFTVKLMRKGHPIGKEAGGKALGLQRLIDLNFRVPKAFVCVPDRGGNGKSDFTQARAALGKGNVAVRSSAPHEDGAETSAAGQYESFLNIENNEELYDTVLRCFASSESTRVKTYREFQRKNTGGSEDRNDPNGSSMAVIVQKMVAPKISGVLFSIDPVTGNKNTAIIETVTGTAEALVGGMVSGERYGIDRKNGRIFSGPPRGILSEHEITALLEGALQAEAEWGCPVDMEWAIDSRGTVQWLQARPITAVELDDLDTPLSDDEVITRCNIGEMLPGAATPLTLSVFAEPLDWGLREMSRREGVLRGVKKVPRYINHVENHLFMNLTSMYLMARNVAGASREAIELNILGRVLPSHDIGPRGPGFLRFVNGVRYAFFLFGHNRYLKKISRLGKEFRIPTDNLNMKELYGELQVRQDKVLNMAYFYHYLVSAYSGAMNGILAAVLSGGKDVTVEAHGKMGMLLTDIPGIESAALSADLAEVAAEIKAAGKGDWFCGAESSTLLQWLSGPESGRSGTLFSEFLKRHGHRCIREAELRSKDYETYPEELLPMLKEMVRTQTSRERRPESKELPEKEKAPVWILKKAKEGVRQREYSKSMLILTQHQFKKGYRALASMMKSKKLIPDTDLIYFFTREEIGELLETEREQEKLIGRALRRRERLPKQMRLQFPEVSRGKPVRLHTAAADGNGGILEGTPVSRGTARGRVRIVTAIEEAYKLRKGEIMVAPFTDIGWTPFFGSISGLVTEIGGALSHGAVVAREYGLPMVSNISGAVTALSTGMEVQIDGHAGTVTIL